MASEPNENNISCSVCGVPLDQPSPLCGAYAHPEPPGPLDVGQRIQDQKFSEFLGDSISKVEIHPDKWHDHTMKAIVLPSKWDVGPPPSPEEIKAQQLMYQFVLRIERMNLLFQIGAPTQLTNLGLHRLQQFKMVISDEVSEGCDLIQQIITRSMVRDAHDGSSLSDVGSLDADQQLTEDEMVAFADWLGDLVVYVFSEAARWGIDLLGVLKVIMDSQDSKLGPDGKPIHDPVTNKFLKGPNYVAPEAAIKALLFGCASRRPNTDSPTSPPEKFECPHCGYRENSWVQDGSTYFCSRCLQHVRSPDLKNNSEKSCGGVDTPTDKP